ncbi:MAG: nucleotidyltransferase domain-containing protein [Oscillospiraceae bacterium]|nr:nucleotidyltransferase domain-containing protein [Oscillospiraceae bacterium]
MDKIKRDLDIIKGIVLESVPATAMYLFGSYAYGEPNEDSDLDVYVVVPNEEIRKNRELHSEIFLNIHRKIDKPFDLLFGDKANFDNRSNLPTLERKIIRDGVKIYG